MLLPTYINVNRGGIPAISSLSVNVTTTEVQFDFNNHRNIGTPFRGLLIVRLNYENSGFTFTNQEEHKSIIVINRPDSAEEFIDTYNHEKNHVEMHICKEFGIDPYSEKAAYLSGQLAKKLFKAQLKNWIK